jgi:hypothetical protein
MRLADCSFPEGVVPEGKFNHAVFQSGRPNHASSLAGAREKAQEFVRLGGAFACILLWGSSLRSSAQSPRKDNADEKTA